MKKLSLLIAGLILTGSLAGSQATGVEIPVARTETPVIEWIRQLGTRSYDIGHSVSIDGGGNAYVTGYVDGGLDGNVRAGSADMFLTKYDTDGSKRWTRQMGTSNRDVGYGVSLDSNGNAYVAGYTEGALDGNTSAGHADMFLAKYDSDGSRLWTRQMGSSRHDRGYGLSLDGSGNAYVTGYTEDALDGNTSAGHADMFLTKYDSDGIRLWTKQLGTAEDDNGNDVSVDSSGNAYVIGGTKDGLDGNTNAGEWDVFLTKYAAGGSKLWTRQLGTSANDSGHGVSVDSSGNAYVTGETRGNLDGNTSTGQSNMFLAKYGTDGDRQWICQLDTDGATSGLDVSVDSSGNAYVAGKTYGSIDGNTDAGRWDIFLAKYDTHGAKLWTCQFGTKSYDYGESVSLDGSGNAYVTGYTQGDLDGNSNAGEYDIFLVKISTIPEPSTLALLCMGVFGFLAHGWRRRR